MNPQIRKLQYGDIDRVYDLGMKVPEFSKKDEAGHRFWPKSALERFANQGLSLVIEDQNLVVGFLLAVYQPITQKLTWENMSIDSLYQNRGLADECFKRTWEMAKEKGAIFVEGLVASDNLSAQKMLERLGFKSAGDYLWMLKWQD